MAEYAAVRDGGAGLIELSSRGRILVSGAEVVMFLNGLITNDMKTLAVDSWMPAVFPNVQGRLLASVRVIHRDDGFLIDTESATHETTLKLLERFTLAGDFRVADVTSELAMLSLQGKRAEEIIRATLGEEAAKVERQQVARTNFADEVTVIRATHTAEDGFDLFVDAKAAGDLRYSLTSAGAQGVSSETCETLRIEAGIARYGVDMDETNVVTARILADEEKEIGRVTSSTFSPNLARTIALGYVKYDYLAPGTQVKISVGDNEMKGAVADLPFIRGSWYPD